MKKDSPFTAWALIVLGVLLLLNQVGLFEPSRPNIIMMGSLFLGLILLNKGRHHPQRHGILGGSFFVLFALTLFLMKRGLFAVDDTLGSGLLLIDLGLANIIYFISKPEKLSNLTWGLIFAAAGTPFVLIYMKLVPLWLLEDIIVTYWPVLLILFGLGLLGESLRRRRVQGA